MICKDIINQIEARYSRKYAMEWDNVGLLVGRTEKEVQKIYVAVDLTDDVLDRATEWGADLIVTHHPLIFKGMKHITDQDFLGRRVMRLIQNDISYYAMHTNYDVKGMAELSADLLGLVEQEVLETTWKDEYGQEGIGRIGQLKETLTLKECCDLVKKVFQLEKVKVFGDFTKKIERVAICPGSGKSTAKAAIAGKADLYITGDMDHHEGIDSVAQGMAIIDAGHYGTEYICMEDIRRFLETELDGVSVKTHPVIHPFQIV